MKTSLLLGLFAALASVSCREKNEIEKGPDDGPHALLLGTAYSNAGHAFATHINDEPTSFWRSSDVFQISPGTNSVQAAYSDRRVTFGYKVTEFVAVDGADYVIARVQDPALPAPLAAVPHPSTPNGWIIHDRRERVTIRQKSERGLGPILADTPKEDYIFGQTTAEDAMAEYWRKNP